MNGGRVVLAALWEPARGTHGRRAVPDDSGIGLALVKKVADSNGGSVRYEQPTDGGARFVLTLPRGAA